MAKLLALWTEPSDVDGFTADYLATHKVLCEKLPGIESVKTTNPLPGSPYHRVSELAFASMDALLAGVSGAEGQELMADSGRLQEQFGNKVDAVIVDF